MMHRVPPHRLLVSRRALRGIGCAFAVVAAGAAAAQEALPEFTCPDLMTGTAGTPLAYVVTATHGPASYFAGLPGDLAIDPVAGSVSGQPGYPYRGTFPVFATNGAGTVSKPINYAIAVPSGLWLGAYAENEPAMVGFRYGAGAPAYTSAGPASGVTFQAAGLPPGLGLDASTGQVTGTPVAPGEYPVVISAFGSAGATSRAFTLSVAPAPAPRAAGVARVSGPRRGTYDSTLHVGFTAYFNVPVVITGTPRLAVSMGDSVRYATWDSPPLDAPGSAVTRISLTLPLQPSDLDVDGITPASRLDVHDGAIVDQEGNPVDLNFTPPDCRGVRVCPHAPPVPQTLAVTPGPDTITISGVGGEQVVAIARTDIGVLGTVRPDANGAWSYRYPTAGLAPGTYAFTVQGRLADAPIYSEASAPVSVTLRSTPPLYPGAMAAGPDGGGDLTL